VPIADDETFATLHDKLAGVGAGLLPRALAALSRGGLEETPQAEEGVTYAHKITSEETKVDWSRPAAEVDRHIRGLSPFPGAHTEMEGVRLKLLMSAAGGEAASAPGTARQTEERQIAVTCGDGREVLILRLQRSGRQSQSASDYLRGAPLPLGASLS
jgi:methionyl-tRNA formyltransferase